MAQQRVATAGPDRFLLGIVAGTVVLLVVSVIVVVMLRRSPVPVDPNSPAGVVQAYVEAMRSGDNTRAYGYLTPEARATANARNWSSSPAGSDEGVRIVIETTSEDATTATVRIDFTRFSARAGPFGSSTIHHDLNVRLVRVDGSWLIDQPVEPYALY